MRFNEYLGLKEIFETASYWLMLAIGFFIVLLTNGVYVAFVSSALELDIAGTFCQLRLVYCVSFSAEELSCPTISYRSAAFCCRHLTSTANTLLVQSILREFIQEARRAY